MQTTLLVLQAFQVAFLWLHDWVPLGRLNDVAAVRRQDSLSRLAVVTLMQSVPFTLSLAWSWQHFGEPFSHWPLRWLWISYGILFVGQLRAWWLPYLWQPEEKRAVPGINKCSVARTHAFLPPRHGIVPNTAHILLHLSTLLTLLALLSVTWQPMTG